MASAKQRERSRPARKSGSLASMRERISALPRRRTVETSRLVLMMETGEELDAFGMPIGDSPAKGAGSIVVRVAVVRLGSAPWASRLAKPARCRQPHS